MTIPFLPLVGIDIGSSAVKMTEISGSGSKRKLKALGLELLPPATVTEGVIQEVDVVEDVVANLLDKLKINPAGRRAAISIPPNAFEIKRILVDARKGELSDIVPYEAEQYFQSDINDMYFRYQELPNWSEDPSRIPVLLVGAQRESVDQLVGMVRGCGMRTGVVDCESLCVANAFEFNFASPQALTGVVDIGTSNSVVSLVHNGHLLFTKTIHLGGLEYTRQIMQTMALELDIAETMKIAASLGQIATPEPMQRIISDLNTTLANELLESLKLYFESSAPIPGVNGLTNIALAGGGARISGLDACISDTLKVPAQVINPFSRIQINPNKFELDYILGQGHVYSVAVGLGLRQMGDDQR